MSHLLIVEDKTSFRELLSKLLSPPHAPHRVDAAGDVESVALQVWAEVQRVLG